MAVPTLPTPTMDTLLVRCSDTCEIMHLRQLRRSVIRLPRFGRIV